MTLMVFSNLNGSDSKLFLYSLTFNMPEKCCFFGLSLYSLDFLQVLQLIYEPVGERKRFTVPGKPQIATKHTILGFQI